LIGIGLVTEGWAVRKETLTEPHVRPSEDPNRIEILSIYGEWCDTTHADIFVEFGRDINDKPVLSKPVKTDLSGGRMRNFFPPMDQVVH